MLKILPLVVALLVVAMAFAMATSKSKRNGTPKNLNLKPRRPLSPFEEKMFFALRDALPNHIVLAQVSFSALVTSRQDQRNYYDRKYADFVLCDQSLSPIVVIELDDSSHKTKVAKDAKRDAMLATAGYKTIRYTNIPSSTTIQNDIATTTNPQPKAA